MGYRHYFYKVSIDEVEKVKDMSYDELYEYAVKQGAENYPEEGVWFSFIDDKFLNKEEVFEFGKLYFDDTSDRIYSKGIPLFSNPSVQERFDDYFPYVVGKEGLLEAIKIYEEKITRYYEYILNGAEGEPGKEAIADIQAKLRRMRMGLLVNIDEHNRFTVTNSWFYENSIFNLVHLLKTIDWGKYTLLFYGW